MESLTLLYQKIQVMEEKIRDQIHELKYSCDIYSIALFVCCGLSISWSAFTILLLICTFNWFPPVFDRTVAFLLFAGIACFSIFLLFCFLLVLQIQSTTMFAKKILAWGTFFCLPYLTCLQFLGLYQKTSKISSTSLDQVSAIRDDFCYLFGLNDENKEVKEHTEDKLANYLLDILTELNEKKTILNTKRNEIQCVEQTIREFFPEAIVHIGSKYYFSDECDIELNLLN